MAFDSSRISEVTTEATRVYIEQGLMPAFDYCNSLNETCTTLGLIATTAVMATQRGFFAGEAKQRAVMQGYVGSLIDLPEKPLKIIPVKEDLDSIMEGEG